MQVAFAVQNAQMFRRIFPQRVQVEYYRPPAERDDPAAIDAMAANVCIPP